MTEPTDTPEPFRVVMELLPSRHGEGPPINRLRRALKCLTRSFGIRCVSIGPEQPPTTPATPLVPEVTEVRVKRRMRMKNSAGATPEALNANPEVQP